MYLGQQQDHAGSPARSSTPTDQPQRKPVGRWCLTGSVERSGVVDRRIEVVAVMRRWRPWMAEIYHVLWGLKSANCRNSSAEKNTSNKGKPEKNVENGFHEELRKDRSGSIRHRCMEYNHDTPPRTLCNARGVCLSVC